MSMIFLKMDLGPGFALYAIGIQILSQPWLWIIGAMLAYLAFEMFRARKRQKRRERAEANRPPNSKAAKSTRRAIVAGVVVLALATLVGRYFYGSPEYRKLKKECVETGMENSDTPSDDDLHRLWMACRKIGFGPTM